MLFCKQSLAFKKEHLGDAEFTVELLGKQVQLSRAQLYRKLKAIADKSLA